MVSQYIMSKKKSLGSSPIGLKSKDNSKMGFIPDLGVSKTKQKDKPPSLLSGKENESEEVQEPVKQRKVKKKIVSYNLEVNLIKKIKSFAEKEEMYYSSFVSMVLKNWIAENNEQ